MRPLTLAPGALSRSHCRNGFRVRLWHDGVMRKLLALFVLSCVLPGLAMADSNLVVARVWLREPPPGTDAAATYLVMHNEGRSAMRLTGVRSPLARSATLHESMQHNGMSHMTPLSRVDLPVGANVEFKPGGRHIMLQGLAHPLHTGDRVPLELLFADGSKLSATALVVAPDTITGP